MSLDIFSSLLSAVTVFAVTNIDDILILSALFADKALMPRAIVFGQFIGISLITFASVLAGVAVASLPTSWIALLGLLPIAIGVYKVYQVWQKRTEDSEEAPKSLSSGSQLMFVTMLTVANGGDNIGVYIPVFSSAADAIPLYVTVFLVMTGFWCWIGYRLVNGSPISGVIERYGQYVLPPALILIGLHILIGAKALIT